MKDVPHAIPCVFIGTCRGSRSAKNRKKGSIALVVSIGTGIFPTEELGNIDAQNFLFFGKHWFKSKAGGPFQRVENLITLLTQAVST